MSVLVLLFACGGAPATPEPAPAPPPEPVVVEPAPEADPCDPRLAMAAIEDPANLPDARISAAACLEAGRLDDARTLVEALFPNLDADPDAHLIAARVLLAQQAADGSPCEHDAYTDDVLAHVSAIAGTSVAPRLADPAFAPVHGTWRYRAAALPDATLADRLAGTTWWGPAAGVYGNQSKVRLDAGGTGVASHLELPDDGPPVWVDAPTTWRVDGDRLFLGGDPTPLTPGDDGTLGTETDRSLWRDTHSECEA